MFAGSLTFLRANLFLLPAITLFSLIQALLSAFAMLALSSLTKSRRFVSIMYAGVIFFTAAMYQALRGITGSRAWAVISPGDMLDVIANAIFRSRGEPAVPVLRGRHRRAGASSALVDAGARAARPRGRGGDVTIIATEHLSKWYGQVSGLNDVTVTVPPGITGLLGPNGAGKSTFMKLVTGQLRPSKGTVADARRADLGKPGALSSHRVLSRAGRVLRAHDRPGLGHGARDAERPRRRTRRAAAARRALEAVDLMDAADKKIGAYSKGMRQRVKLAQAIAHDPELLILDEPLSGMDPIMRRRTIRLIKDWARAGKSVLVSSHILHEIESMTSNILLINNGRIVAEGNVHQIRDLIDTHPHTVFIRAQDPTALARALLVEDGVISMRFEPGALVVETGAARRVLRAADRHGGVRRSRRDRRGHVARRQPAGRLQVSGEAMSDLHRRTVALPRSCAAPGASSSCRSARCCGRGARCSWRSSSAARCSLALVVRIVDASGVAPLQDQRRARGLRRDVRDDDLAALPAVHRAGAGRVLRHVAHRRRSRGQDDHLPLHPPDPRGAPS